MAHEGWAYSGSVGKDAGKVLVGLEMLESAVAN